MYKDKEKAHYYWKLVQKHDEGAMEMDGDIYTSCTPEQLDHFFTLTEQYFRAH
jgi:hypothetical protein